MIDAGQDTRCTTFGDPCRDPRVRQRRLDRRTVAALDDGRERRPPVAAGPEALHGRREETEAERKSGVSGKRVEVRVDPDGWRQLTTTKHEHFNCDSTDIKSNQ